MYILKCKIFHVITVNYTTSCIITAAAAAAAVTGVQK
jgi:hypothetical protein